MRGIHRWPVNCPHKGPVTRKMLPLNDVIMRLVFQATGAITAAQCISTPGNLTQKYDFSVTSMSSTNLQFRYNEAVNDSILQERSCREIKLTIWKAAIRFLLRLWHIYLTQRMWNWYVLVIHYNDVTMGVMASQITSKQGICSTVCLG